MSNVLAFNPNDFLHSLAKWMVAQAAAATPPVAIQYAGTPRQLWRNRIVEADAADPAAALRIYGGPALANAAWVPRISVQVWAQGTSDEAVLSLAQTLFETHLEASGRAVRMTTIAAYKAADDTANGHYLLTSSKPLQRPGIISRDVDRGRAVAVWNTEIAFEPAA